MQRYCEYKPTVFDQKGLASDRLGIGQYFVAPVIRTRDSDPLEESNFHSFLRILGGESDNVQVHRFGHWGPGWFEIILINPDCADIVRYAQEISDALEDYPVVDENDLSEREWEAIMQYWEHMSIREKADYCRKEGESVFAARAEDFSDFADRAPRAAEQIEESGRE